MYQLAKYLHIIFAAAVLGSYVVHLLARYKLPKLADVTAYQHFYRLNIVYIMLPGLFIQLVTGLYMSGEAQFDHNELWLSFSMSAVGLLFLVNLRQLVRAGSKVVASRLQLTLSLALLLGVIYLMSVKPYSFTDLIFS